MAIAVALANQPHLLLADEPTGALDNANGLQVMDLLNELRQRYDLTILLVTHDMQMARFADRVLTLRDGSLGQNLSEMDESQPHLEDDGRIQLPPMVRSQLADVDRSPLKSARKAFCSDLNWPKSTIVRRCCRT